MSESHFTGQGGGPDKLTLFWEEYGPDGVAVKHIFRRAMSDTLVRPWRLDVRGTMIERFRTFDAALYWAEHEWG